jgi:hypothetical protein
MHKSSSVDVFGHGSNSTDRSSQKSSQIELSGHKSTPDLTNNNSVSSSPSLSLHDSPSTKHVEFVISDTPTTNGVPSGYKYVIATDSSGISRYTFSEGTLKLIENTFGRKRHQSESKTDKYGFISMWDFAGQYIFYATHQVFLSPRAVYLLVLDLSKPLEQFVEDEEFPLECNDMAGQRVKDYGDFWLRSIHTFCGDVPGQPPVILVGTHRNKMGCAPDEMEEFQDKYFEDFRKLVEHSPVSNHIQPEQFAIDNTLSEEEFDNLKVAIVEVAKRQKHWNQEIPASWLPLERYSS